MREALSFRAELTTSRTGWLGRFGIAASCTALSPRVEVGRNPELLRICKARRKVLPSLPLAGGEVVHETCGASWGYFRGIEQNPRQYMPRTGMLVQRAAVGQASVRVLDHVTNEEAQDEHQQTEHQKRIPVEAGVLVG